MALVTDINGECRAGTTDQTVWYPQITLRPKTVLIAVNAGLGELIPNAFNPPRAPVYLDTKRLALPILVL